MQMKRRGRAIAGMGVFALAVTLAAGGAQAAKTKKGKTGGTADVTVSQNQAIPPATIGPPFRYGIATSTITLGKRFKGRRIDDVDVRVQLASSGAGSALDPLFAILTAPNGNSVFLFEGLFGTTAGPLTLDDETPVVLNFADPADFNDPEYLASPYVGRAEPAFGEYLSTMDGGPAKGIWTLKVRNDDTNPAHVHNLVQWGLRVKTRAPYASK